MTRPEDLLRGWGVAPGRAVGPVVLLDGPDPERDVPTGAVIVARIIHPHLAPLLFRACAVVVEEGALLQHATTLAREFGIPAVVGAQGARRILAPGSWVEVDGSAGTVRAASPPPGSSQAGPEGPPTATATEATGTQ